MAHARLYPVMLSTSEAAVVCGVDRKVLYEWYRRGLPLYKIHGKKKCLTADIVDFVRANFKQTNK